MYRNLPPTSDTIQFGIARLAIANTSAAKKRAPEIMLNLSIFFVVKQVLFGFRVQQISVCYSAINSRISPRRDKSICHVFSPLPCYLVYSAILIIWHHLMVNIGIKI